MWECGKSTGKWIACHECERSCTERNGPVDQDRRQDQEGSEESWEKTGTDGTKRRSRNSLGNRMALIGITVVVGEPCCGCPYRRNFPERT